MVLRLCAAAVLAGMRSFIAIAGWIADVPAVLLALLYSTPPRTPGGPSKTTLWRILTGIDAAAVDAAIGSWLAEQARHATAATGASTPARAADTDPADRADCADRADRAGRVDRADRADGADGAYGAGGADGADGAGGALLAVAVMVRGVVADDGAQVHLLADRGHGRITTRTIQTLPAPPDLPFPTSGRCG